MADSLLAAVRHCGSEDPVRSLLSAGYVAAEVNKPGASGVNALGLAVWRNHEGLVEALLEAGADPNAPDTESGWSPLHRALHWGLLRIAAALLRANASLSLPDWRGRTPLDLLSAELKEYLEPGDGDVFSWGNGNNYTLGTGSTDVQLHPVRVESLHDQQVLAISAAKFHSAAVSVDGRLLTWGWGRGGRLGHPEAHVHSGEGAVIAPLAVASLGKRQVAAVAAGKHHTVLCTTAGEVFTCGSNRHGQLGYAVDSQPTPRRVSSLRQRVVAVAAANKHSVAVTASGDVYTWGCNVLGQLGYGTSDSASNPAPRLVEAMRGKPVAAAAAAKRHTLVLTASGEVYTWGHRGVSPRRVQLAGARDAASLLGAPISFHRGHSDVARPVARAICAGAAHSSALTATGVVLCWRSADPALQVQEVGAALASKRVVSIAAGKYRTAAVSDEGDVYMWEGRSDYFPAEGRQPGSGSKKPGSASAGTRARPIPGRAGFSFGSEVPLPGGSPADLNGGSYGSHSHSRRAGSWIERFAQEREAAAASAGAAPGSYGAAGSAGRPDLMGGGGMGSGSKPSRASDTFERIRPERVEGLKRAVSVAVGEKHSLAVQRWSAAQLEGMSAVPWLASSATTTAGGAHGLPQQGGAAAAGLTAAAAAEDYDAWYQHAADGLLDASALASPREDDPSAAALGSPSGLLLSPGRPSPVRPSPHRARPVGQSLGVPSLQRICEEEVARRLVDPRTCLQVLEYADVAGADVLRSYCLAVAVCNLDAVLLEAGGAFEETAPHLLAELERLFKLRLAGAAGSAGGSSGASSGASVSAGVGRSLAGALHAAEPAGPGQEADEGGEAAGSTVAPAARRLGSRLQPGRRPTAAAPWLGDEGWELGEGLAPGIALSPLLAGAGGSSFRDRSQADAEAAVQRLQRTLQKKLQQIDHLAAKLAAGEALDVQQKFKLEQRPVILSALAALEGGMAVDDVNSILRAASAGREAAMDPELAAAGSSSGCAGTAPGSASATKQQQQQQKGKGKRGVQKGSAAAEPGAAAAAAAGTGAPAAVEEEAGLGDALDSGLLGSSPPESSLVPAFGFAGSVASAAEQQPGALAAAGSSKLDSPPPAGQMRSQVGFASSSASDGVGASPLAAAGAQQQLSALGRLSGGTGARPKSASKRKGGLSMFLRGELEQASLQPAAVAAGSETAAGGSSAVQVPAWGASSAVPAGATSLKQILDQEAAGSASKLPVSAQRTTPGSGIKLRPVPDSPTAASASTSGGPLRLSLASFMQSSPLAMQQRGQQLGGRMGDRAASPPLPAWGGASGASPPGRQPSFKTIQEEQQARQPLPPSVKIYSTSPPLVQRPGAGLPPWRPPAPAPPGASAALLGTSPSGSGSLLGTSPSGRGASFLAAPVPQHSKWYIPEESRADIRKSLKSIQSEEEAMAELAGRGFTTARVLPSAADRRSPRLPRPAKQLQQQQQAEHQQDGAGSQAQAQAGQDQQQESEGSGSAAPIKKQQKQGDGGASSNAAPGQQEEEVGAEGAGRHSAQRQKQQRPKSGGGRGAGNDTAGGDLGTGKDAAGRGRGGGTDTAGGSRGAGIDAAGRRLGSPGQRQKGGSTGTGTSGNGATPGQRPKQRQWQHHPKGQQGGGGDAPGVGTPGNGPPAQRERQRSKDAGGGSGGRAENLAQPPKQQRHRQHRGSGGGAPAQDGEPGQQQAAQQRHRQHRRSPAQPQQQPPPSQQQQQPQQQQRGQQQQQGQQHPPAQHQQQQQRQHPPRPARNTAQGPEVQAVPPGHAGGSAA